MILTAKHLSMMKFLFFLFITVSSVHLYAGRFVYENFNSGFPTGWSSADSRVFLISNSPSGGYNLASGGQNVIFQNCTPSGQTYYLTTSSYDFSGRTGIRIGFGLRKTNTGVPLIVEYSTDGGTTFIALPGSPFTGTTTWSYQRIDVPDLDGQSNVVFRFGITTTSNNPCSGSSGNTRIDDFAIGDNNVLPVDFHRFEARPYGNYVKLSFTTASETNNDYFSIERCMDGKNFEVIAELDGAGNSHGLIDYEFIDYQAPSGINYYRIKQTDYNGQYSYSDVKSVLVLDDNRGEVSVSPNPCRDVINISTDLDSYLIFINDLSGKLLMKNYGKGSTGLNISSLDPGVYYLTVENESFRGKYKIVKL